MLSQVEQNQLGSDRTLRNGELSAHPWPSSALWPKIREHLVARSLRSNPLLDSALTAYTPGETLGLLDHPQIAGWHRTHASRLPDGFNRVVFVPCAKTKPWTGKAVAKSRLYSAYNVLLEELPDTCFVTISEPLGVVPQQFWADFPQYDNPGLFVDDSQRSGMTTSEWLASPFRKCYGVPFDTGARSECLQRLGDVVGRFIAANADKKFIAFVDPQDGTSSTHGLMLDRAITASGVNMTRYAKRPAPRTSPLDWMRNKLA